ncbi:Gfo/Idh/MocA family oxidoreductase [Chelativorans sp. Marseille-P2723]|uniref:Gfo/Idh/MocA family protein n=1 Tax=Chelativorans sp. Marseille-P2723 TaxID=2709133 RepID=UPI00156D5D2D|nr:Gfo/Idh/MocA family oxidoreductase [Chelativorans sp. Marseille-P2723]
MISEKLRAAVIGAGWYAAHNHIPVLKGRHDVFLDAVCRKGVQELERVRDHFGFAFASEDHRVVLERKPDIAIVASPHHLHYEHTRDALMAGAHVLCEKPFTLDPRQAWELVQLANEKGRHLVIANGYNYLPRVAELKERIADGMLGEIEHVMVSFISATRDVFFGDEGLHSWKGAFFRPDRTTWQDPSQGGGFAYGQLSHSLALMLYLSGLEPESVSAQSVLRGQVDLANSGVARMQNGAVISISGAAAMPQGNRGLMRLFLTGSKGLLTAEFDRDHCKFRGFDGTNKRFALPEGAWIYNCTGPVESLLELAKGKGRNQSCGRIGAHSTAMIAAMLASSAAGGAPQKTQGPL